MDYYLQKFLLMILIGAVAVQGKCLKIIFTYKIIWISCMECQKVFYCLTVGSCTSTKLHLYFLLNRKEKEKKMLNDH